MEQFVGKMDKMVWCNHGFNKPDDCQDLGGDKVGPWHSVSHTFLAFSPMHLLLSVLGAEALAGPLGWTQPGLVFSEDRKMQRCRGKQGSPQKGPLQPHGCTCSCRLREGCWQQPRDVGCWLGLLLAVSASSTLFLICLSKET